MHGIGAHGTADALAKSLIDIGHNLKLSVVGEAVETSAQMEFLRAHGCDQVQGEFVGAPLEGREVEQLLREQLPA